MTGNESVSLVQLETYNPKLVEKATPTNNTLTEKDYLALFQVTAVPYKRDNKTAGAIIAAHLLNNDNSIAHNISTKIPNSYSDISCNGIRISGNISSETNPSYIGMLQQPKQIETIKQGKRYYGQNKLAKDLDHLVVSDPIYNLQGNVIGALTIGQPSQGLDRIKEDTMIYISISALLCLAIVLGISAIESKKGAAPIIRLSQIAKQIYEAETISDEHLSIINNLEPPDIREIKDLQLCFSRMSNSLYKQKQEILRYLNELEIERNELQWLTDKLQEANTTLEAKVQEKTMELKNAITNLKTLNNHKTKFLLNTSHELRTPLNSIIGFSEMLYDELYGPLNEKQKEYVQIQLDSAHHLLKLINDILDLSLIEQNKITIYKQSINLSELIASVLNIIKNEADSQNILILSHLPPNIPNISIDPTRIKQVLYNILSNAVKFTPSNGQIDLEVNTLPDYIQISVTDTGIGIKKKDIDFVFDDFYQGETLYEKKYEGAGLGLPLSKRLIELHNGKIELRSSEGNGTNVTIYVPYK
ncbi:ATP-binding protein [Desulfosporosinus sp. PR]|uniref:ATP-binding protein n=1 Tax=Candidatus Desulfosporosinus nitrosoreducens TaxID=3401928 RepID=UPI0027F4D21A|nr:ATP-binding protein [Desulfosporosinus sp. PR]MDQ7092852.1 ATP-binding protein [Desulfosporosinus sp. PR]